MTFYEPNDRRQQLEILRRFSSEVLKDKNYDQYAPYTHTEEIEGTLTELFLSHHGISSIALFYGCPEIVIMQKILSMDLYSRYDEVLHHLKSTCDASDSGFVEELYRPHNQHDQDLEMLRRSTPLYPVDQFEWTDDKDYMVFFLFKMGEDISDIALLMGCTEWMVMQKFIDDGLYDSWDTPWFAYSFQESRDKFLRDNGYRC